jgi:MFS family permease
LAQIFVNGGPSGGSVPYHLQALRDPWQIVTPLLRRRRGGRAPAARLLRGFLLHALGGALILNSFGAYFVFLQADFGWSRTLIAGAPSMARLESGLIGPLQSWLINRLGPQKVIRIGLVLFGGGYVLFSQIDSVLGFYGSFFLIAIGSGLAGYLTVNIVLANWFERRRARAMSLAAMGLSFSGLLVPVIAWSLEAHGWRTTAFLSALAVFAAGFPAAQLFRSAPEPYGLMPDGRSVPARTMAGPRGNASVPGSPPGLSAREALRTPAFWFLVSGHTAALFAVSAMTVHFIPYLVDQRGASLAVAATIYAGLTSVSWVGQLLGGYLGDRIEKRLIAAACMLLHSAALVILILASSLPLLTAGALLHGLAWGTRGPLMMAIRADYFGRRSFATIEGFASVITTVGLFLGPLIVGSIADQFGDYRAGFAVLAGIAAAGAGLFALAPRPMIQQRSETAA